MKLVRVYAALSGALAVAGGAYGAHGAHGNAADWLKTGAQYQMVHAVAALLAVQIGARVPSWLFVGGAMVFAGTLYAMALGGPRWLGAVTPLGGAALILGWLWLAWSLLRTK